MRWAWLSRALADAGHEIDVVTPRWRSSPREANSAPGIHLHEVRAAIPGLGIRRRLANEAVTMFQSAYAAASTPRPDVVLTTVPALSTLPLGWAVSRLRHVPMVLELRDAWPHILDDIDTWGDDGTTNHPPTSPSRARVGGALTRMMWAMERDAAATIVTAEALAHDLEDRGLTAVALARNVVQHPVEPAPLPAGRTGLNVLYLGSFGRAQKLSTLVRAALVDQDRGVDVRVRLVGNGAHEVPLERMVARTGAPVEVLPRVPGDAVAGLYDWADTVVVMLRDWDGMQLTVPSKLYEALHSGRHITASVTGEAAAIVRASGAGDVVAPEDAEALADLWQSLAADRSLLQRDGLGQQWLAENGRPEVQAEVVEQVLQQVVDTPRAGLPRSIALAQDLRLAGLTSVRHLGDDSATFFVQVARRLQVARRIPLDVGPARLRVLTHHLADQPDEQAAAASRWQPSHATPLDRLAASSLLSRGRFDLVPEALVTDADRARQRLEAGDFQGAIDALPEDAPMARRIQSQRRTMQADFRVAPPGPVLKGWHGERGRVLHVLTNSLPDTRSGYTQRSQAVMQAQTQKGWTVEAATRIGYPVTIGHLGKQREVMVDDIVIHRLVGRSLPELADDRLAEHARLLDQLVQRRRPEILHTTTDYTNALVTEAVAQRRGIPWVYEMRGQLELTWLSKRPAALAEEAAHSERLRLQRDRETACAMAASAVVVLSEVQKADLVARGVPADAVTVAANAVDQQLLARRSTPSEARARLGLDGTGLWFGAVSSVVGYEGFETLLDAVAELRRAGLDARCVVVGDGTSRPGLIARAESLGIADACHFPGRVGRDDALTWVEALDAVVVPRLDTPVCRMVTPLKPVEAMALGRPVIASDLPALRELVEPVGGALVRPEDPNALAEAIAALAMAPERMIEEGAAGRGFAASRTWAAMAGRYDRLYKSLRGTP